MTGKKKKRIGNRGCDIKDQKGLAMVVFEHIKCPLNRYTFKIRPVRLWVEKECEGVVLNLFAGKTRLAVKEIRNDIDKSATADYHMDALEFLLAWKGQPFDTILLDPPYSYRKSMELYHGRMCSPFRKLKDAIRSVIKQQSKVITFGYHSVVMGSSRGFKVERIALFSHGGAIHDTIATIERFSG